MHASLNKLIQKKVYKRAYVFLQIPEVACPVPVLWQKNDRHAFRFKPTNRRSPITRATIK